LYSFSDFPVDTDIKNYWKYILFVGIYKNETGGKKVNFNSSSDINYSKMISASIVNCLAKYYLLLVAKNWLVDHLKIYT